MNIGAYFSTTTAWKRNGGKMDAMVLNVRDVPDRLVKAVVADYERGLTADIYEVSVGSRKTCRHRRLALPALPV